MNSVEQAMFSDVVKLVNKTKSNLEFLWDSVLYEVPAEGFKMLPRHIAMKGIEKHPIKIDSGTGLPLESLFGIDEPESEFPIDSLGEVDLKAIRESHKLEEQDDYVNGKKMKKSIFNLMPGKA